MTNWHNPTAVELIDQVIGADWTWYERSSRKLEDKDQNEDGEGDGSDENDDDSTPFELTVKIGTDTSNKETPPHIRIRQRIEMVNKGLASVYDVAVTFRLKPEFPTDDFEALGQFVDRIGFDYVLGLIRGAFNDGARAMGIEPPLIPAVAFQMQRPQETAPKSKNAKPRRRKGQS